MADLKFDKELAALLVIDPYNDFIKKHGIHQLLVIGLIAHTAGSGVRLTFCTIRLAIRRA